MKTRKKTSVYSPPRLWLWLWLLLSALTAGGCVNDYLDTRAAKADKGEAVESVPVIIRLVNRLGQESTDAPTRGWKQGAESIVTQQGMEATFSASTRGLSYEEESAVNNVYVFFLRTSDNRVHSVVEGKDVTNATTIEKTFAANLEVAGSAGQEFRCIVLANAGGLLSGQNLNLYKEKTYEELQRMLAGETYTAAPDPAGDFAMWGEAEEKIGATRRPQKITIHMLRALARVDIGLGISADRWDGRDAAGNGIPFRLRKVFIFKPQSSYSFLPIAGAYNAAEQRVTLPSPAGEALGTPFEYDVPPGAVSLTGSIYLPEADVRQGADAEPGDAHHTDRCAIVVQGSYQGHADTYYRIDFRNGTPLTDLLRNHRYRVSITAVSGDGATTAEEAYKQVKNPISVLPDYSASGLTIEGFQADEGTINGISQNVRFNISLADPAHYKFTATCSFNKASDAFITKGNADTITTAGPLQTSKTNPSTIEGMDGEDIWLNVFRTGPGDVDIKGTLKVKAVPKAPATASQYPEAVYSVPITIKTSCKIGDSKIGTLLWADRNVGATPRDAAPVGLNYTNDVDSDDHANTGFKGGYYTFAAAPGKCDAFGADNHYEGTMATGWRLPTGGEQKIVAFSVCFSKERGYILSEDTTAGTVGCWFPLSGYGRAGSIAVSGYFWSSSPLITESIAYYLSVYTGSANSTFNSVGFGASVRCVR